MPGRVSGWATVGIAETPPESVSISFARPKSRILTKPSVETITFSGFRSRWTIPAAWAFARPSETCAATLRTFFTGIGPGDGQLAQRLAVDELHRDEGRLAFAADLVDRDDVGMVQRRGGPRLLLEPREAFAVGRERLGKDLQRDFAAEPRVPRPVDLSHSPGPERAENFESPETGTGRDGHEIRIEKLGRPILAR